MLVFFILSLLQRSGHNGLCESTGHFLNRTAAHRMTLTAVDQYMSPCFQQRAILVQVAARG